ncbi:unnamed protein product [Rhizophagus irregularis]|uniref:Uncharacterized protein n=1 Tax=Rhizophagus irregularis TaxID=588596 RepID=A0A2N1P2V6_9GLOM|nr:hypothetical protein RhiirC2_704244 [Rhizophagus irregularis]CAB4374335.1 unnamed protein product [Rhizophagus irregularis]CAB5372832.1 unnamed protein product [Rhizophagus irregularis]
MHIFEKIGYRLDMSICTGISNEINNVELFAESYEFFTKIINDTTNHQNVSLNNDYPYYWLNITTNINNNISETISHNFSDPYCNPHTIPNNLLSLNFESFQYFNDKSQLIFNIDVINSDKNNYINNGDNYDIGIIKAAHFSLYLGRAYVVSYKPIIVDNEKIYTRDVEYKLELNPRLEQLPIQLESNEVRVKVLLLSEPGIARFETTRKYGYTDLISNLGGFYGAIAGIFSLFFGMQRHEPWGLAQKYLFSCTRCRKSLKRYFAKKYVSSAGIPLVEKVNKRPEGSSLEERVQILESLLQDYYLDDYYLKKIKDVRTKHKKLLKKYGRKDNENTELNASLV